jgi:hypothetical protein
LDFEALAVPALVLVSLTSLALLVVEDWRLSILALAAQYVGVFFLVGIAWPLEMAITKVVAGWMAGAVLGMAAISLPRSMPADHLVDGTNGGFIEPPGTVLVSQSLIPRSTAGMLFRLLAAILVGLVVLSAAPQLVGWSSDLSLEPVVGSLLLIGMGLVKLGFTSRPLHTILGLLTALAGFEILYAAVEDSTLVAGLLAGVNLGLALVGAYLLVAPQMEEA